MISWELMDYQVNCPVCDKELTGYINDNYSDDVEPVAIECPTCGSKLSLVVEVNYKVDILRDNTEEFIGLKKGPQYRMLWACDDHREGFNAWETHDLPDGLTPEEAGRALLDQFNNTLRQNETARWLLKAELVKN